MSFPFMPAFNPSKSSGTFTGFAGAIFTVPSGITSVSVSLSGAGGGGGAPLGGASGGRGGNGALVKKTDLSVVPGEELMVVGGAGGDPGRAGSQILFRRGATTLMSASAGGAGRNAYKAPDEPVYYPGFPGADGSTGTGGTVTAGYGAGGGGSGSKGANGYVKISW